MTLGLAHKRLCSVLAFEPLIFTNLWKTRNRCVDYTNVYYFMYLLLSSLFFLNHVVLTQSYQHADAKCKIPQHFDRYSSTFQITMIIDSHSEGTLADKDLGIGISHGKVTYSELVVNINKHDCDIPIKFLVKTICTIYLFFSFGYFVLHTFR